MDNLTQEAVKEEIIVIEEDAGGPDLKDFDLEDMDTELWGFQAQPVTTTKKPALESKLWVEKYKPKGYMDLLSEEVSNSSISVWKCKMLSSLEYQSYTDALDEVVG